MLIARFSTMLWDKTRYEQRNVPQDSFCLCPNITFKRHYADPAMSLKFDADARTSS
jgi:hypothetical protein